MESRSMSLVDKGTQTNDEEDPTVVGTLCVCESVRHARVCNVFLAICALVCLSVGLCSCVQTSGGDTERGAVCSGLSRESCTAILRSVSAERNVSSQRGVWAACLSHFDLQRMASTAL